MTIAILPASYEDGEALREIERRAGERFREIGMGDIAEHEPASVDVLAGYAADGRAWVAVDEARTAIGYVLVDVVDGCAHVEQVSVLPDRQGMGVGRALLDQVRAWAQDTDRWAITLTTFSGVPWNQPLYEHFGFRVLGEDEIGPGLRAVCEAEAAHGLDPATRVCMRFDIEE